MLMYYNIVYVHQTPSDLYNEERYHCDVRVAGQKKHICKEILIEQSLSQKFLTMHVQNYIYDIDEL